MKAGDGIGDDIGDDQKSVCEKTGWLEHVN
jgi:hypothetical protein